VNRYLVLTAAGILTLFVSGCATRANYAKVVSSWQRHSGHELVQVWGYPDRTMRLDNGNRLYTYVDESKGQYPLTTTPGYTNVSIRGGQTQVYSQPTTISGGGHYEFKCKTWFELNKNHQIVHSSFRGNGCVAEDGFVKQFLAH
jgi:hypothetical protein